MAQSLNYKNYERGTRIQQVEETFNKGMYYTDKPLTEGYSKLLVNYDVAPDGAGLIPRPGLRFIEDEQKVRISDSATGLKLIDSRETDIGAVTIIGDLQNNSLMFVSNSGTSIHDFKGASGIIFKDLTFFKRSPVIDLADRHTPTLSDNSSEISGSGLHYISGWRDYHIFGLAPYDSYIHYVPDELDDIVIQLKAGDVLQDFALTTNVPVIRAGFWDSLYNTEHTPAFNYTFYISDDGENYTLFNDVVIEELGYTYDNKGKNLEDLKFWQAKINWNNTVWYAPYLYRYVLRGLKSGEANITHIKIKLTHNPNFINADVPSSSNANHYYELRKVNGCCITGYEMYYGNTRMPNNVPESDAPILNVANVHFVKPTVDKAHNISLLSSDYIYRHVGTYGWLNAYYYFRGEELYCCGKYEASNDGNTPTYNLANRAVDLKELTPSEALATGYNMLSETPYIFEHQHTTGEFTPLGILAYSDKSCTPDTLLSRPKANTKVYFKAVMDYDDTYTDVSKMTVKWYWMPIHGTTFTELSSVGASTLDKKITCAVQVPAKEFILKLETYYDNGATHAMETFIDASEKPRVENRELINYNLHNCTGMAFWQERLVLWGVPEDKTMLFISDVRDPGYFPFPHGVDTFEEPIVHAQVLLDKLLVFTTSQLYMLSFSDDGLTYTKTCLQRNLYITDWDVHMVQTVKNMVVFKSNDYYYMVVPKAGSLTGELTIAPIYKPIEEFLDNFEDSIYNVLKLVYNKDMDLDLVHYYNYLDYEDIYNTYVFAKHIEQSQPTVPDEPDETIVELEGEPATIAEDEPDVIVEPPSEWIHVSLVYNSVSRHWRIYTYVTDAGSLIQPIKLDATARAKYAMLRSAVVNTTENGSTIKTMRTDFRQLQYDKDELLDYYSAEYGSSEYLNSAVYDSGCREYTVQLKKRYRELQFMVNNLSKEIITFKTAFYIDSDLRKPLITDRSSYCIDADDSSTVCVILDSSLLIPTVPEEYGAVSLAPLNDAALFKVRVPISGKGYAPRIILKNSDFKKYELLNISYIYRLLNSR